jgi:hypothetical protein
VNSVAPSVLKNKTLTLYSLIVIFHFKRGRKFISG